MTLFDHRDEFLSSTQKNRLYHGNKSNNIGELSLLELFDTYMSPIIHEDGKTSIKSKVHDLLSDKTVS